METEEYNKLTFLDVLLTTKGQSVGHSVYRKPIHRPYNYIETPTIIRARNMEPQAERTKGISEPLSLNAEI